VPATSPTIAEQITALQEGMRSQAPAEILSAFSDEQATLDAAGLPAGIPAVGTPMPDADLLDVAGKPTTLSAIRQGKPAVVVFYRGAWCPYCNLTLHAYQEQLVPALAERGVVLIAISPQKPDGSLTMQEKHDLTYSVVSDPGNRIAAALGVLTAPSEAARATQRQLGLDLTEVNADGTYALPMPTVVLVDADGPIRWLDVRPNYATRTEPAEILAAISTHLGQPPT
jgi:peroxiredoxin